MASSQGTQPSRMNKKEATLAFTEIFKRHFLLHTLRFLFFLSADNIMADAGRKQQKTALFLSTIVTRTRRHTELTKN
jgi:hypothetical protein